jgi:hypothetical protein
MAIVSRFRRSGAAGGSPSTPSPGPGSAPGVNRRTRILVGLGLAAVLLVGASIAVLAGGGAGSTTAQAGAILGSATATVQRRDLVETDSVTGTLGYRDSRDVYNRLSGTVTWVPAAGALIKPDHVLYRVDGEGVYLFNGTQPARRAFVSGMSDGSDVLQLNTALRAMGYDPEGAIVIDRHFSEATAEAIKRWQKAHGLEKTGQIEFGRIVFQPGTRRVETVDLSLGGSAGSSQTGGSGAGAGASAESAGTSGAAYEGSGASVTTAAVYRPGEKPARAASAVYEGSTAPRARSAANTTASTPATTPTAPTTTSGPATAPPSVTSPSSTTTPATSPSSITTTGKTKKTTAPSSQQPSKQTSSSSGAAGGSGRASGAAAPVASAAAAGTGGGSAGSGSASTASSQTANPNVALTTTSLEHVVTVPLEAAKQGEARRGDSVQVTLPSGAQVGGHILSVASVAVSSSSSSSGGSSSSTATVNVEISLDTGKGTAGLDQAPVNVAFAAQRESNVLAIPVTALVATSGGYAVDQVVGSTRKLVTVTPGLYAGGFVAVTGVAQGTVVTDGSQ